jgi:hypothetical protein
MSLIIVYQIEDNGVAIVTPTEDALNLLGINEIARKDVPSGVPYRIIDSSDIPEDRVFRNAWEIDMTTPDGFGIGSDAWFAEQEAKNDSN